MANLAVTDHWVRRDDWIFEAACTLGGGETELFVNGADLPDIRKESREVIVRGLSIGQLRAGGGGGVVILPLLRAVNAPTGRTINIYLDRWVTAADKDQAIYYLETPLSLASGKIVSLLITGVALDYYAISCWGTFVREDPLVQPTQPVGLKEIVWPIKTKRF